MPVIFRFLALIVLAAGLLPNAAFAQKFIDNYKKPMPKMEFAPEAEFNEGTVVFEAEPFGMPALAYSIRLSKNWTQSDAASQADFSASDKVFTDLARYYGPPSIDARSNIVIKTINLEYRQNAEQWMLWYLLKRGLAVQGFHTYDENRAEALYVVMENDIQYAIRSLVVLNGKHAILVEYSLPTDKWQDLKVKQAQVLSSFQITNKVTEDIEEMAVYRFLDISGFEYPKSWQLKAVPLKLVDRMSVELFSLVKLDTQPRYKRILDGKMQIDLIAIYSAKPLNEEVEDVKAGITKNGLVIGELVDFKDSFDTDPAIKFKAIDVYDVQDQNNDLINYELWFGTLASDEYYFFVTLLTPSRDQDFFTWVKNTQTYMDMVAKFKPALEEDKNVQ